MGDVEVAKKAFPANRKEYIKKYALDTLNDDNHEAHNHFTRKQLDRMKETGQVPKSYNVHHKKPIFRCEPNENPNNLELLTEDFIVEKIKNFIGIKMVKNLMTITVLARV